MRPAYWVPPVVWMAVIFLLSSDLGSADHTKGVLIPLLRWLAPWATPAALEALHGLARKAAHVSEYAMLAALWFRAFRRGRAAGAAASSWLALGISLGWAVLDEWHQSTLPTRTGSAADVALDGAGAVAALAVARAGGWAAIDAVTRVLLWLALAGGAVALAVDAWAGIASGWLWITTPAALLGLLAGRRLRR
jgi:VanZ family protein